MTAKKHTNFEKVLIANRGEIACRLITACHAVGLKAVAVYSDADASARHVKLADEAVLLGAGPVAESYLNVAKLLAATEKTGATAVHPGYGFLSENAEFAKAVSDAGLVWIGPKAETIRMMGNKIAAKKLAEKAKVPTLPWALLADGWTSKDLEAAGRKVGFPLLLKAAAGGGGRGMRLVEKAGEIEEKAEAATREASGAFGSGEIFLESYLGSARHIEVQVLGDRHGTVVTVGERECSVQRRHQKVIEEAPAPNLSDETRNALWKSARNLAASVGYESAGTCEFLVDAKENIYFLEMNTRLQVEHPVTELVWGVDLPALQFQIARGEKLPEELGAPKRLPRGHAIEARIYAEDPTRGFMPAPGKLGRFEIPPTAHVRVDTGYESGAEIPLFYDAMLAKVIAWGAEREQARATLAATLSKSVAEGVAWNGPYLVDVLNHPRFIKGKVDTAFLADEFGKWKGTVKTAISEPSQTTAPAAALTRDAMPSAWLAFGSGSGSVGSRTDRAHGHDHSTDHGSAPSDGGPLVADYPGKVLKVLVAGGDKVDEGQIVVTCESMKMEYSYLAPLATRVKEIHVREGQVIAAGTIMVTWEAVL